MGKTLKRSLIVSIIILFLSTACLPAMASEEKPDLINSTIEPVDTNEEIITFISGSCYSHSINKSGFVRDVEIYAGMGGTGLSFRGLKRNPLEYFGRDTLYIHAPRFIGIFIIYPGGPYGEVLGIAFGDIEYS